MEQNGQGMENLTLDVISAQDLETRYSQLVHALPAAIYTCDAKGYVKLYNKAAVELWGREPEAGKDLWCGSWKIYNTDGSPLPLDSCPMAMALKLGKSIRGVEIVIERPDGTRRHVLPHPDPIFDANGNILEAVNMLVDVTDTRMAELAIKESEERFRTIASAAPVIIWMSDDEGNFLYLNKKWEDFTGKAAKNGLQKAWLRFVHENDQDELLRKLEVTFAERISLEAKFRYRNSTGGYSVMKMNGNPTYDVAGRFTGYVGMFHDITLHEDAKTSLEKQVTERTKELQSTNRDLIKSNNDLEQFAYVTSHDLQEPIRKILTFAELLERDLEDTEKAKNYLGKISDSAGRMMTLVKGLLNYSRLSKKESSFGLVNLNEVFSSVRMDLELVIQEKCAIIKTEDLPSIEAIPLQMIQLFYNLLGNALKFSSAERQPQICLACKSVNESDYSRFSLDENRGYYELIFKDNGIGFSPQYSDKIFAIFQRLHDKNSYPGAGIGLALCKNIVLNHHGVIYAKGEEEKGAEFHIILPALRKEG
jgi:PAS domain S-box-containing protein